MKYIFAVLGFFSFLVAACSDSNSQFKSSKGEDSLVYFIDVAQSKIEFVSIKDGSPYRAFVGLQKGQLIFHEGVLSSAQLLLDMNTLGADGKDSMQKAIRTTQLMDTNCFSVARYPLCQFNLLSALPIPASSIKEKLTMDCTHQIQGDLMMKGINKRIAFPAKLLLHDRTLSLDAYPQLRLQDWLIVGVSDHVGFTPVSIHLVAHRQ